MLTETRSKVEQPFASQWGPSSAFSIGAYPSRRFSRPIDSSARFCNSCGALNNSAVAFHNPSPAPANSHAIAAKGFGQVFGIDPRTAYLTFIVDLG
jgi:hypothetical protein